MDSFSFESRGCAKLSELEVEQEQLGLLFVAMMGRVRWGEPVVSVGAVTDNVGEDDERDSRESSPQPTGAKEMTVGRQK